jgi:hypothetical protein
MWLFFSNRLRMFVIFTIVVPLVGWLVRRIARLIERRSGRPNRVSRTLDRAADFARR